MVRSKTHKSRIAVPRYANYSPRSAAASRVGESNRSQNTGPERLLRSTLRVNGIRYRSHPKNLPGRPDVVLVPHRIVVFCDGDFWHGRDWPNRKRRLVVGWNAQYWVAKIERNRQRDRQVTYALRKMGWRVVRVWESDVRSKPDRVAKRVLAAIAKGTANRRLPTARRSLRS
jgi:DNA mismatch endonuclease (patch repair protein)